MHLCNLLLYSIPNSKCSLIQWGLCVTVSDVHLFGGVVDTIRYVALVVLVDSVGNAVGGVADGSYSCVPQTKFSSNTVSKILY